jgi:hypothetical protein
MRPRFPGFAPATGGYESFYVKAAAPDRSRAVWIRYTVSQRPGQAPSGSMWFTWFDRGAAGPVASKVTVPAPPRVAEGDRLHVGAGVFHAGALSGAAPSSSLDASWDLEYDATAEPLWHLPRPWMYTARLPRTKLLSPVPATRLRGSVRMGADSVELDGWPAMVGHNWGSQHAERWIWLQGGVFEGHRDDTWLDVALGRLRLGRFTTPWVANGALSIDGRRHLLGGLGRTRATRVTETVTGCEVGLTGPGIALSGRVSASRKDLVGWLYADPDGSEHDTVNCSIADLVVEVRLDGAAPVVLRAPGSATFELGMREKDHGVPLQSFADQ